jgi:Domain of unknown function (DUF4845)
MKSFPARCVMKNSLQQQRGLTMISWVFVLAILAFCGMFGFAVVPMYAENMYVEKALKSLVEPSTNFAEMSDTEIRKKLQNFYTVNNVRSPGAQEIIIDRKSKALLITVDYEIRANLFWNIDVVTDFKNHLDSDHPNLCCKPLVDKSVPSKY